MSTLPTMPRTAAVRSTRRERMIRRITGRWPQSFVDKRLDAFDRDNAEASARARAALVARRFDS